MHPSSRPPATSRRPAPGVTGDEPSSADFALGQATRPARAPKMPDPTRTIVLPA